MAPNLELAFTMRSYVSIKGNVSLGAVKGGLRRSISSISRGYFKGPGLDAKILPGGCDVSLFDTATNVQQLDVRASAQTAEGESFYINYVGVMKVDDLLSAVLRGEKSESTSFGDHEWFTSLQIETSSEAFKWVQTTLFIGRGRCIVEGDETAAEYEIYKVVN